jgi:hypothetical protein
MRNYISRLHLVLVATLLVLTVALGLVGWSIRPSSGGFSAVPADVQLFIPTASPLLQFTETISSASGGGAVLTVEGTPQITDVVPTQPFTLVVNNPGEGRLCTPSVLTNDQLGLALRLAPQHVRKNAALAFVTPGRNRPITISGRGYFYVRLCWPSNGPVALNGAYLSARFPPTEVFAATKDAQGVARQLTLGSSDATTADFSIQSLEQPTRSTDREWIWAAHTSGVLPQALPFTAVNTSETQHDSYDAFISGIFFGVAGGALVSLVAELVAPFRPRQERRPPEPGG